MGCSSTEGASCLPGYEGAPSGLSNTPCLCGGTHSSFPVWAEIPCGGRHLVLLDGAAWSDCFDSMRSEAWRLETLPVYTMPQEAEKLARFLA
ncbi:DUF6879 family protein, partial [Streptomyces acidiscabies]|uniref:DUF6879 family protein n=1 Tax=Streptomyces acidiscabies TaxID=42234 RepID=UPI0039872F6B